MGKRIKNGNNSKNQEGEVQATSYRPVCMLSEKGELK